jgi:hypothetical protein
MSKYDMKYKNRLWAYGCSWTEGNSLKDNTIKTAKGYQPTAKPSAYAYPKVLARFLRMECTNRAFAGQGNDAILYNIIDDYDSWDDGDIIIVMWTGSTRKVFFEKFPGTNLLTHSTDYKWYMEYLKKDSETNWFDSRVKSGYNKLTVEKLAKGKNVLLIQSETDFAKLPFEIKYNILYEMFDSNIEHFVPCTIKNDRGALDNEHPSTIWHAKVATFFYNYIKYIKAKE